MTFEITIQNPSGIGQPYNIITLHGLLSMKVVEVFLQVEQLNLLQPSTPRCLQEHEDQLVLSSDYTYNEIIDVALRNAQELIESNTN